MLTKAVLWFSFLDLAVAGRLIDAVTSTEQVDCTKLEPSLESPEKYDPKFKQLSSLRYERFETWFHQSHFFVCRCFLENVFH